MLEEEVRTLVVGEEHTRQAATNGRCVFRMKRPTAERDTALIVLMLDTGISSGEASRLNIKDIDLGAGEIIIYLMAVHRGKQRVVSFRLERQHVA